MPPDAYDHPGKWLALSQRKILAIRDTRAEVRKEFAGRRREVSFFHVPTTTIFAR